ncbi:hypothetical protein QQF64_013514 [Cirrhinus molitorella]|uniref:Uncharacterized protein n=1 Tax=Cirrhinus molitorella TaxID=172907 RepID=A0ABR3LVI7_9TELE
MQGDQHTWKDLVEAVVHELHGAAGQANPVTASDYQQAEMEIYKRIQHDCFPEDLHHLKEDSGFCVGGRPSAMYNISVGSAEDGRLSRRCLRCQTYRWPVYGFISQPSTPQV